VSFTEDQAADYEALRTGIGGYRLARDVVAVHGPDAASYLQGQLSQDLDPVGFGSSADALLLEPDGKLVALLRVTRTGEQSFVLDADAGTVEAIVARLRRFTLRSRLTVEVQPWSCVALRGAGVPGEPPAELPPGAEVAALVDWHGWRGLDLLGPDPASAMPEGLRWCSSAAWEACRVESGVPVAGHELDGATIAAEVGLVERAVSFTKGCYTGQELVARLDARGSNVARRLRTVVLDDPDTDPAALAGAELTVAGRERPVGALTSAAWSPVRASVVALAFVHRSVAVGDSVGVGPSTLSAQVLDVPLVDGSTSG
jgi:folate-binding protein YgfZ